MCVLVPKIVNAEGGTDALVGDAEEAVALNLILTSVIVADLNIPNCFEEDGRRRNVQIWSQTSFILLRMP